MDRAEAGSIGAPRWSRTSLCCGLVALVAVAEPEPMPPPMRYRRRGRGRADLGGAVHSHRNRAWRRTPVRPRMPRRRPIVPLRDLRPSRCGVGRRPRRRRRQSKDAGAAARAQCARRAPRRSLIGDDILKGIGRDPRPRAAAGARQSPARRARASTPRSPVRFALPSPDLPAPSRDHSRPCQRGAQPRRQPASARVARVVTTIPVSRSTSGDAGSRARVVQGCTPIRGLPAQYYDVPARAAIQLHFRSEVPMNLSTPSRACRSHAFFCRSPRRRGRRPVASKASRSRRTSRSASARASPPRSRSPCR